MRLPPETAYSRARGEYNRAKAKKVIFRRTSDGKLRCRLPDWKGLRTFGYGYTYKAAYLNALQNRLELSCWLDEVLEEPKIKPEPVKPRSNLWQRMLAVIANANKHIK